MLPVRRDGTQQEHLPPRRLFCARRGDSGVVGIGIGVGVGVVVVVGGVEPPGPPLSGDLELPRRLLVEDPPRVAGPGLGPRVGDRRLPRRV